MKLVTHIDIHEKLDEDIQFQINNALGLWSSKNDADLYEDVRQYMLPYTLKSVEFEKNRPHSLTSFKQETQMRYKDQKTTIFSELANIMEKDQFAMYDLLDAIVESLTPDQLNQIEDVIVNQYGEN